MECHSYEKFSSSEIASAWILIPNTVAPLAVQHTKLPSRPIGIISGVSLFY